MNQRLKKHKLLFAAFIFSSCPALFVHSDHLCLNHLDVYNNTHYTVILSHDLTSKYVCGKSFHCDIFYSLAHLEHLFSFSDLYNLLMTLILVIAK